jgi:peptide/nickel transport system ATP-binding protein
MQKLLEVRNLTKIFALGSFVARAKIVAVEKVSFSIAPGEIFTIAGESGCGKTTTARIILGFEYPTWGEVLYRGQNLQYLGNRKAWFKEVQAVFQNPFETFNPSRRSKATFLQPFITMA